MILVRISSASAFASASQLCSLHSYNNKTFSIKPSLSLILRILQKLYDTNLVLPLNSILAFLQQQTFFLPNISLLFSTLSLSLEFCMAGESSSSSRELDQTPTWAVSGVCAIIIIISIVLEKILHKLGMVLT